MKRSCWPGRGMKAPTCLHRQGCAAFAPSHAKPCIPWGSFSLSPSPGPSFGLQAPETFGGFGVKAFLALRRQAVGVFFEQYGAPGEEQPGVWHLPKNVPGHVLPAPDSPGLAPLVLLASPKDRKVWGLAGRPGLAVKPPPRVALGAHGAVLRGGTVSPEPMPCSGRGLRLCGAVDGHQNYKKHPDRRCAA